MPLEHHIDDCGGCGAAILAALQSRFGRGRATTESENIQATRRPLSIAMASCPLRWTVLALLAM